MVWKSLAVIFDTEWLVFILEVACLGCYRATDEQLKNSPSSCVAHCHSARQNQRLYSRQLFEGSHLPVSPSYVNLTWFW